MPRLCERPGCSQPADVAYGFDPASLTVWLDGFEHAVGPRSGALCRRHADAMVVPLGWLLDDRREPVPRLFNRARMDDLTDGSLRPKTARRTRQDRTIEMLRRSVEQLTLDQMGRDEVIATGGVREVSPAEVTEAVAAHASGAAGVAGAAGAALVGTTDVDDVSADDGAVDAPPVDAPPVPLGPVDLEGIDQSGPMGIVRALLDEAAADEAAADEAAADEAAADESAADEATDPPWTPRFDEGDDLSGLLRPRGRLLSRAFRGVAGDDT